MWQIFCKLDKNTNMWKEKGQIKSSQKSTCKKAKPQTNMPDFKFNALIWKLCESQCSLGLTQDFGQRNSVKKYPTCETTVVVMRLIYIILCTLKLRKYFTYCCCYDIYTISTMSQIHSLQFLSSLPIFLFNNMISGCPMLNNLN